MPVAVRVVSSSSPASPGRIDVEDRPPADEAVEFVRFCYRRRQVDWPQLYDEMCAVASRGAFRGLCYDDLTSFGISFALTELPRLAAIAQRVAAEEAPCRAPVAEESGLGRAGVPVMAGASAEATAQAG